jgi:SagB-type dehydrogenase family enzyme
MRFLLLSALVVSLLPCAAVVAEEQLKPQQLPAPQTDGGRPLMQALKDRSTSRSFSARKLPPQVISNLLWAAFGVNRPDTGKRTAPSAMNWQEIDVYVSLADGLFRYEAKGHRLDPVLAKDIRALTGRQPFVAGAPVNLIFVADRARMGKASKEDHDLYAAAATGFISQNVYLFCASEGLATVVRGSIDREALAKAMGLRPDQRVILAQTVGYPPDAQPDEKGR